MTAATQHAHGDQQASRPVPVALAHRLGVRDAVVEILQRSGAPWAWQGAVGAPEKWVADNGPADLDIWWSPSPQQRARAVREFVGDLAGAVVADARQPSRLMHLSIAFQTPTGLALVDLTEADLRVGPVLLVPAGSIEVADHRLVGVAGAADMALRPILRGRLPHPERLAQARAAWESAAAAAQAEAAHRWVGQLGPVADEILAVLAGARPDPGLPGRARRALARVTLGPAALPQAWRARKSILPAGRHAGPLGLRTRGIVVAVVGTDGSGKSTLSTNLRARLEVAGFPTRAAYFGMAHGNLPGVGLARRLLGVAPAGDRAAGGIDAPGRGDGASGERPPGAGAAASPAGHPGAGGPTDHPGLRRAAAWYYAVEYQWRYLRQVAPARRKAAVVICDRYVYDLRESPWPGSPAARVAQWLMPDPDLLVLPDAPAELIHARKPERSLAEQAASQKSFRDLLATHPARVAELVVDTSGADPHPELAVAAAVITAAHDMSRGRQPS